MQSVSWSTSPQTGVAADDRVILGLAFAFQPFVRNPPRPFALTDGIHRDALIAQQALIVVLARGEVLKLLGPTLFAGQWRRNGILGGFPYLKSCGLCSVVAFDRSIRFCGITIHSDGPIGP